MWGELCSFLKLYIIAEGRKWIMENKEGNRKGTKMMRDLFVYILILIDISAFFCFSKILLSAKIYKDNLIYSIDFLPIKWYDNIKKWRVLCEIFIC